MEIKGNQARIGVDAPQAIKIYREEIYLQILEENRRAAAFSQEAPTDLGDVAQAWKDGRPKTLNLGQVGKKQNSDSD